MKRYTVQAAGESQGAHMNGFWNKIRPIRSKMLHKPFKPVILPENDDPSGEPTMTITLRNDPAPRRNLTLLQAPSCPEIEVFFDGACARCSQELTVLRRLDQDGLVRFTDITAPGFDASAVPVSWNHLTERVHARMEDGRMLDGVAVFRCLYRILGLGWLIRLSDLPGVEGALDWAYEHFEADPQRWTRRCADKAFTPDPTPLAG
jgi:predicted DCC family thiol-disulfide oxidoreductase YuxK